MSLPKRLSLFILTVTVAVATGCYVQSLHPLYTDPTTTFDAELVGTWVAEEDEEFVFEFIDTTRASYTLLCEESGSRARFEAVLVELAGVTFLDMYPDEPETDNSFYKDQLLRVHNVLRLKRDADTLWVSGLDAEWLQATINRKHASLSCVPMDGAVLITASTAELQAFIRKFAGVPEAFTAPARLIRTM